MNDSEPAADSTPASPTRTTQKKLRDFEVTVVRVVEETRDAVTLVLDTGEEPRDYKAGQFVNIAPGQFAPLRSLVAYVEERKGRREVPRAYSMCSAPHEPTIAITIKEEPYRPGDAYPPLLSPFLTKGGVRAGDRFSVRGYTGPYVTPDDVAERADHMLHVCAGSGIVPNLAILKDALHRGVPIRHTLMFSNKTWDDIIYRDELADLAARHADRLTVIHHLTREGDDTRVTPDGRVRRGRIAREHLAAAITDPERTEVFACGPAVSKWEKKAAKEKGEEPTPRFMETTLAALRELIPNRKRVHHESFG